MAATLTKTATQTGSIEQVVLSWTCDSDGTGALSVNDLFGTLLQVEFAPGTAAPTDQYDLTLTDSFGFDVLAGDGANQSATTAARATPLDAANFPMILFGNHTLNIANAGNAKRGVVTLYLKK